MAVSAVWRLLYFLAPCPSDRSTQARRAVPLYSNPKASGFWYKSWKTESSESFSKVVLKVIPKKGTAADMDDAFECLKTLTGAEEEEVLSSLAWANDWNRTADA